MKIIYSRKQAQAAVEFINANNPFLAKPVSLREVCENVLPAWINRDLQLYKGIVFSYHDKDLSETYCFITVAPAFFETLEESVPYELEVTEDHIRMQLEHEIASLKAMDEELGLNLSVEELFAEPEDEEEDNTPPDGKVVH